jgi:hypothetical protein
MRLLFASLAALTAVAFAAPAGAQQDAPAAPSAKPKQGTAAYCQTLKSSASKNACLKRVHAQAKPAAVKPVATKTKTKKPAPATATENSAPPAPRATIATPVQAEAPTPPRTIAVPPLPQKTI